MPSLSALLGGIDHLFQSAGALSTSFLLEVDGLPIGRFSAVSGLQMSVVVETYADGGETNYEHKFPGRVTWDNLVFKRGITHDNNLFNWFEMTVGPGFMLTDSFSRATAGITMLSANGRRLRSWVVQDAFPVRWKGPDFDATAEEVPTEELEVAHHGLTSVTF